MRVTKKELRWLVAKNATWWENKGEHPTATISDDLFDRILSDLLKLAAVENGQQRLEIDDGEVRG